MLTVDRYVARSFLSAYLILLLLGVGQYVLFDLLGNMDEFTKNPEQSAWQSTAIIWDYYLHNLPLYYSQLSGPIMAFAAAFTVANMLRNNELVALLAAGMPLPRLAAPILGVSVVLVALWFANREFLIPSWAEKIARTKDDVIGQRVTGVHCARDENNAILTATRFLPTEGVVENVAIITAAAGDARSELIRADRGVWNPARHVWVLDRGIRYHQAADGEENTPREEPVLAFPFTLTPEQLVLRRDAQWADLLSLRELNQLVASRSLTNRGPIEISRHQRVTQPLVQWLLMVLALPFFLCRAPTNVLSAGGKALLMSGAFYVVVFIAASVVKNSAQASLLAWIPILVFGPIAVVRLGNVRT
ncbi:MAG: LptF/LptG family permease [Planctomycetes bacterium]|nr:LptF/LptG family permease [Planctomycetota bacterium]